MLSIWCHCAVCTRSRVPEPHNSIPSYRWRYHKIELHVRPTDWPAHIERTHYTMGPICCYDLPHRNKSSTTTSRVYPALGFLGKALSCTHFPLQFSDRWRSRHLEPPTKTTAMSSFWKDSHTFLTCLGLEKKKNVRYLLSAQSKPQNRKLFLFLILHKVTW